MIDRQMKNEKGFTLVEMMIAAAMSVALLGTAIYTYTKQDKLLQNENRKIHLRDHVRLAMDELLPMIRLAGAGFPPGDFTAGWLSTGVDVADAATMTFKANTEGISTTINLDVAAGANGFLVPAGTAEDAGIDIFTVGNSVVFFDTINPGLSETQVIATVSNLNATWDRLLWVGTNANAYSPIADGSAVVVNEFHTYILAYNAGTQQITLSTDGAAAVGIANKVSSLTFSYFDANGAALTTLPLNATDRGNLRRVQVSITVVDDVEADVTATLTTNINMRNMGT